MNAMDYKNLKKNYKKEFLKIKNALSYHHGFDCIEDGKFLGEGAFGHVVKANCRNDGKTYAMKIIPIKGEGQKYQKREIKALITFNMSEESKRNVIEYFASWIIKIGEEKRLCIQMELCALDLERFIYENNMGGPRIIQAQGSPRFYQQVFQQILDGLDFIHSIRWVHRDIHPGNILVVHQHPQQISDIQVKIADFGLARYIGAEFEVVGLTILPKLEKVSQFSRNGYFRAPELISTDTYDFKVDVYSAGLVLYFISRYLEDPGKWRDEMTGLKEGNFDPEERISHNDDKKLSLLIKNLIQVNSKDRLSARDARQYMFPTQPNSTDAKPKESIPMAEFLARKENEQDFSQCCLDKFTMSAMTAAVERRTGIKTDRQVLREERNVEGEIRRIKIDDDEDVQNIFKIAAQKGREVVVVVFEQAQEDNRTIGEEFSYGEASIQMA